MADQFEIDVPKIATQVGDSQLYLTLRDMLTRTAAFMRDHYVTIEAFDALDAIKITADDNARVNVENNGTSVGTRRSVNFIPGAGVAISGADNSGSERVDLTIATTIPQNTQSNAYVLALTDIGKHISISTGGVTVPKNTTAAFAAGDVVSIYNNSGSNQTITQATDVTLRLAGTATTGNRTLAQRGICTILCIATNEFVAMGAGLT